MSGQKVSALYFDGQQSEPQTVALSLAEGGLRLEGAGGSQVFAVGDIRVSERLGGAPRLIDLPGGASCQVADHEGLAPILGALSMGGAHHFAYRPRVGSVMAALLAIAVMGWVLVQWGIPLAADLMADRVPESLARSVGKGSLEALDRAILSPSALSPARQQHLRDRYAALDAAPGPILFRRSGRLGANAVALPDGSIVVTDELVALAGSDEEILAVIAHEAGHVVHRDHLRGLIQASMLGAVMTLWAGDVSALVATVPAALMNASYSREAERAADDHAVAVLRRNHLDPRLLGALLERLETNRRQLAAKHGRDPSPGSDILSSHPLTQERLARLAEAARR